MDNTYKIIEALKRRYPDAECSLRYSGEAWRLLVMARLSAQCTDARVNVVCETLFREYPTVDALADARLDDVEAIVLPCGLYHVKARDIIAECAAVRDRFGGEVPRDTDALLSLPGVGRKIANLLLGDVFGVPGIVADTHCIRICGRLGFYPETVKEQTKVERILAAEIPAAEQTDFCHRLVLFGREICRARSPLCGQCPLAELCASRKGAM